MVSEITLLFCYSNLVFQITSLFCYLRTIKKRSSIFCYNIFNIQIQLCFFFTFATSNISCDEFTILFYIFLWQLFEKMNTTEGLQIPNVSLFLFCFVFQLRAQVQSLELDYIYHTPALIPPKPCKTS